MFSEEVFRFNGRIRNRRTKIANNNTRTVIRIFWFVLNVNMKSAQKPNSGGEVARWTFLTNHAHVLLCLAGQPDMVLRQVSAEVGITERAVQKIVAELEAAGLLIRHREGRRNVYSLKPNQPLRHPIEAHCTVEGLIQFVLHKKPSAAGALSRTGSTAS